MAYQQSVQPLFSLPLELEHGAEAESENLDQRVADQCLSSLAGVDLFFPRGRQPIQAHADVPARLLHDVVQLRTAADHLVVGDDDLVAKVGELPLHLGENVLRLDPGEGAAEVVVRLHLLHRGGRHGQQRTLRPPARDVFRGPGFQVLRLDGLVDPDGLVERRKPLLRQAHGAPVVLRFLGLGGDDVGRLEQHV